MRIRTKIRYYIQRYRCRKKNCTKCKYFTKDNECTAMDEIMDHRWYFPRYVALVTNCDRFEAGIMTPKENLMAWLQSRCRHRDRIRRMIFRDELVDEWERIIQEHFHGKSADIIIVDDINDFDDMGSDNDDKNRP